jgi:beta-glucosidase
MKRPALVALALTGTLILAGCTNSHTVKTTVSPTASDGIDHGYLDPSLPISKRVDILLGQMTNAEKFGQMTQVEEDSLKPGDVASLGLGSVLHGGGSIGGKGDAEAWKSAVVAHEKEAVNDTRLGIPLLYGVDAVHGFGGMYGATVFPQQVGLGAANDAALMTKIGAATAQELSAAGIRWDFSPVLAVPSDIRWGRTYEAFSQDPTIVAKLGAAYIEGLQSPRLSDPASVLATAKHFIGDGSTVYGSSTQVIDTPYLLDQGNTPADTALLNNVLLPPYKAAIDAGAQSVMATYSSWGGEKVHGDAALLTDTLRGQLGFTGFVVSDWAGCDQINPSNYDDAIVKCVNAGVDMVMTPYDGVKFQSALAKGVASGTISQERIDEAVSRILTVKFEMDVFANPYPDPAAPASVVGSPEHRAIARTAVQESQVLLKNDGALPIPATTRTIAVVGNAANDMGVQAGGWTQSWQGSIGTVIPGTTIWAGIQERAGANVTVTAALPASGKVDVCVAAVGETPYAEGKGDSTDLALPGLSILDGLKDRCGSIVLVVVSGRPVIITDAIPGVDAVVAAWLPGTAGEGIADTLFGDVPFTGKLPDNWPKDISQVPTAPAGQDYLFPMGFGLSD